MKYQPTFRIVPTEEEARAMCERLNASMTRYMRKNHPAHYTPWSDSNRTETGFIVWYRQ